MLTKGCTDRKVFGPADSDGADSQATVGIDHVNSVSRADEQVTVLTGSYAIVEVADGVVQESCIGENTSTRGVVGKQCTVAVWGFQRLRLEFRDACIWQVYRVSTGTRCGPGDRNTVRVTGGNMHWLGTHGGAIHKVYSGVCRIIEVNQVSTLPLD